MVVESRREMRHGLETIKKMRKMRLTWERDRTREERREERREEIVSNPIRMPQQDYSIQVPHQPQPPPSLYAIQPQAALRLLQPKQKQ